MSFCNEPSGDVGLGERVAEANVQDHDHGECEEAPHHGCKVVLRRGREPLERGALPRKLNKRIEPRPVDKIRRTKCCKQQAEKVQPIVRGAAALALLAAGLGSLGVALDSRFFVDLCALTWPQSEVREGPVPLRDVHAAGGGAGDVCLLSCNTEVRTCRLGCKAIINNCTICFCCQTKRRHTPQKVYSDGAAAPTESFSSVW